MRRVSCLLALRSAELFNASGLANDLGLRRETVEHYVAVLERLFLVRRLRGIEVKAGATIGPGDGRGLRRLADRYGKDFDLGAALFRRRPREVHGALRAAWQELLDPSKTG